MVEPGNIKTKNPAPPLLYLCTVLVLCPILRHLCVCVCVCLPVDPQWVCAWFFRHLTPCVCVCVGVYG